MCENLGALRNVVLGGQTVDSKPCPLARQKCLRAPAAVGHTSGGWRDLGADRAAAVNAGLDTRTHGHARGRWAGKPTPVILILIAIVLLRGHHLCAQPIFKKLLWPDGRSVGRRAGETKC